MPLRRRFSSSRAAVVFTLVAGLLAGCVYSHDTTSRASGSADGVLDDANALVEIIGPIVVDTVPFDFTAERPMKHGAVARVRVRNVGAVPLYAISIGVLSDDGGHDEVLLIRPGSVALGPGATDDVRSPLWLVDSRLFPPPDPAWLATLGRRRTVVRYVGLKAG